MTNEHITTYIERSVLATLRALIPNREVRSHSEAKQVAEHQAIRLLELHGIEDGPVPVEFIADLPKIEIEMVDAPVSGASDLAAHFQVSKAAMTVRLRQTGIADPAPRCTPQSTPFSRSWQYRMNHRAQTQGA